MVPRRAGRTWRFPTPRPAGWAATCAAPGVGGWHGSGPAVRPDREIRASAVSADRAREQRRESPSRVL